MSSRADDRREPHDAPTPPKARPRYVDRGEIARGGSGSIHLVRDAALRRDVAMKLLDPRLAASAVMTQKFVEEAQITGQLDHPNIVPIHELGVDPEGRPYFTMKVVRGRTLEDLLFGPELPLGSSERLERAIEIFLKVCDAVAFAHGRGVIHRDIKPENIMVGAFGEVYLMDWGIARVLRGDVDVGHDGAPAKVAAGPVGTPWYMAPEQARGDEAATDERADVFGLGAVLYQIVTGTTPFQGETVQEALSAAQDYRLVAPEDAAPDLFIPRRLARIVMKAIAREPADRYPSVAELKRHVQRFLHGGFHLPTEVFAPGARVVTEGEQGDCAYVLTHGECEVYKIVGGQRHVLRRLKPGAVFGETAVFSDEPRTATVEAITNVAVLVLSRSVLDEGLEAGSWEGMLVKSLVERFREVDARLTALLRERSPAAKD